MIPMPNIYDVVKVPLKKTVDPGEVDLPIQAPLALDHSASGYAMYLTAGETVVFGEGVYSNGDGKAWKSDADAASSMPCVGIVIVGGNADDLILVLFVGFVRDDDWNWTVSVPIYASETPGGLTETAPSGTGDQVQVIGIASSADIILINTDYSLVEVA